MLARQSWANYLANVCLGFPIYEMMVILTKNLYPRIVMKTTQFSARQMLNVWPQQMLKQCEMWLQGEDTLPRKTGHPGNESDSLQPHWGTPHCMVVWATKASSHPFPLAVRTARHQHTRGRKRHTGGRLGAQAIALTFIFSSTVMVKRAFSWVLF